MIAKDLASIGPKSVFQEKNIPSQYVGRLLNRGGCYSRRRALRAGITDRIQHVLSLRRSLHPANVRRADSSSADTKGTLTGMWISTVLHPAVLLAFADGAGFL